MDLEEAGGNYHLVALGMLTRTNLNQRVKLCKHLQLSMTMLKKLYKGV